MTGGSLIAASLLLGLIAGVLSGMFGIGGGLVIVPALIVLFHESEKTAVGTSLFALMWPVGLLGVLAYWREGHLRASQGAWIALGLFVGAYFGARITLSLPPLVMKRLYAIFLLAVGTYFLYSTRPSARRPRANPPPPAVRTGAGEEGPPQVH